MLVQTARLRTDVPSSQDRSCFESEITSPFLNGEASILIEHSHEKDAPA